MYAIVLAKDEGLARALVVSLYGVVSGISVIGEVPRLRWSTHCEQFLPLTIEADCGAATAEQLAVIANDIATRQPGSIIIPADVASSRLVLAARSHLNCSVFPLPERPLLDQLDDKWQFFTICREHGIPTPKTLFVGTKEQSSFALMAQELSLPFLLKPTNQRDGTGIVLIHSRDAYRELVMENPKYQYSPLVAQEYISGRDIDISVIARDGIAVCSAVQVRVGAVVRFLDCPPLREATASLLKAMGFTGALHIDARQLEDGSIGLIEANPRIWGTINAAKWCGLNFTAAGIAIATDQQLSEPEILMDGCYPGFAAALKERFLGRFDRTELGRRRLGFVNQLVRDPYEYCRILHSVGSLPARFLARAGG